MELVSFLFLSLFYTTFLEALDGFLFSILESEYTKNKDVLSEEALKNRLKAIIDATRYGESGYFWVNDTNAVIVTHPIKPALNGKDMAEYKDQGGKSKTLFWIEAIASFL